MTQEAQTNSVFPDIAPPRGPSRWRTRFGLGVTLFGLLVFLVGIRPSWFGVDRSPVIGFIQIAVFLVGLATICLGGYICLMAFWKNGHKTIAADIGSRLVATGYVVAVFTAMADIFGFTLQPEPVIPFFGPWQATGVIIGQGMIAVGFLLLIPFRRPAQPKDA